MHMRTNNATRALGTPKAKQSIWLFRSSPLDCWVRVEANTEPIDQQAHVFKTLQRPDPRTLEDGVWMGGCQMQSVKALRVSSYEYQPPLESPIDV